MAELGQEGLADGVVFVGSVVDDAVGIDVEDGAQHKFGAVKGVGETGDVSEVAVRHTDDVVDMEGGVGGDLGIAAVMEVFFVGIEVGRGAVGAEAGLVGGGVEVVAEEGIIVGGEDEGANGGFGEEEVLEDSGDAGQGQVVGGGEIVRLGDDAGADLVSAAFADGAEGAGVGRGVGAGGFLI